MKYIPIFSLIAGLAMSAIASLSFAQDASGLWQTQKGKAGGYAIVQIGACASNTSLLCGVIRQIREADDKSSEGKAIITEMARSGTGKWSKGKIFAPDEGKWYDAKMELKANGSLEVAGCVLGGLVCRGQTWLRAQ